MFNISRIHTSESQFGADPEVQRALLPPLALHDCGETDVMENRGAVETVRWGLTRRGKQICMGQGRTNMRVTHSVTE